MLLLELGLRGGELNCHMYPLHTDGDFCIKHDDFCIKYDDFCIKHDDFCIKYDDFCIKKR